MTRTLLAVASALGFAACGGSSSETPPPLEPDPHGFHYAPPAPVTTEDSDAGDAPAPVSNGLDDDDKPRAKASSTWGGVKPAPH